MSNNTNLVERKLPFGQNLLFALQHVFVMVAGAVAVPMMVASASIDGAGYDPNLTYLISCALFMGGVATILQSIGYKNLLGAKIPIIEATSFASVSAMVGIAQQGQLGLQQIAGSVMIAGLFCLLMSGIWGKLLKFFPPVVTGTVVTVIGLSLFPIGIRWISEIPQPLAGNEFTPELAAHVSEVAASQGALGGYLVLALITLVLVLLFSKFLKGMLGNLSVLLAIVGGTLIAVVRDLIMGNAIAAGTTYNWINLTPVKEANWLGLVKPFSYGPPKFDAGAIISFVLIMLVIMTEATGNMIAIHTMAGKEIDEKNLARGLRTSGVSTIISGMFNSYPVTAFAQNVGMLGMTQEYSRFVTATSGIILASLGFLPKFAALFAAVPKAVLGGAGFTMFGMVAIGGIRTLGKVNYDGNKNALIVAISIGVSLIPIVKPGFFSILGTQAGYVLHSGITLGCISAILLNLFFNVLLPPKEAKEEK